jgi:hypothetical protein
MSAAGLINWLLTNRTLGFSDSPSSTGDVLSLATGNQLARQARYPEWSTPISSSSDPLLVNRGGPRKFERDGGPALVVDEIAQHDDESEPVVISAYLAQGDAKVEPLEIWGTVTNGAGETVAIERFNDLGGRGDVVAADGVYAAAFILPSERTSSNRIYMVKVQARTQQGLQITGTLGFRHGGGDARLTGRFDDQVTDGSLNILAQVEVHSAGRFHFEGTLYSRTGAPIAWTQNTVALEVGTQSIQLTFYGLAIRERDIDGPYQLQSVSVSTVTSFPGSPGQLMENGYTTRPYNAREFTDQPFNQPGLMQDAAKLLAGERPAAQKK